MNEDQIKHMVDRFLGWRLPKNFNPDGGISATRPNYGPNVEWTPSGTNLFDATQTDAMVRYLIEGMPDLAQGRPEPSEELRVIARKAGDDAYKRWTGRDFSLDGMQVIADAVLALGVAQAAGGCGDEIEDLRGDAATLRGFIREFEMTPSMMASERDHWRQRALKAEGAGEPAQSAVMPAKLTGELACILECCDPPEHQTDEAVERLIFDYQPMWDRLRAALVSSTDKKAPPTDCEWADWICEYVAGGAVTSTNQGGGK